MFEKRERERNNKMMHRELTMDQMETVVGRDAKEDAKKVVEKILGFFFGIFEETKNDVPH